MKLKFIINKNYDKEMIKDMKLGEESLKYLEEQYKIGFKYLKYSQREYQISWNEINNKFSRYVEELTGYEWFYDIYYCIVSVIHPGISNWGDEPKIVRWWCENPYTQRRITAHELILSHYFEIYKHYYKQYKLSNGQVWALAEIAALASTSLTPDVKEFWPWDSFGYYTDHNYPQIVDLQKKLRNKFLSRKNFDNYIMEGIKLVKNYRNIKP